MSKFLTRSSLLILFLLTLISLTVCDKTQPDNNATVDEEAITQLLEKANQTFQAGEYKNALNLVDSLQSVSADNPDIYFLKGLIFNNLNRLDDARAAYEKALQIDPEYEGVRFNLGNIAMSRGNYEQAIKLYRQEHARHPAPNTLVNMGLAFASLHKPDSSMAAYQRAIALDSSFADAFVLLGQEYKNAGDPERAIELTRQGLA
ncbi:MAG: tetratricopeptide repeat protein, partial [Candidatus Marinimicrobia bacterium]|nr:tetratricopeptide repeat protein [Candidatus Neomarinimicrobiota bacterium]